MAITKIGAKHQVTIPKEVFDRLGLEVGEYLEVSAQGGKIILTPQQLVEKAPAPKLSRNEQELLVSAREKIEAIRHDILSSFGLSEQEAQVAARVGLIDEDQRWWWTEEWQKKEREAEKEIREGRTRAFDSLEELARDLERA